jgi:hypothetical protein
MRYALASAVPERAAVRSAIVAVRSAIVAVHLAIVAAHLAIVAVRLATVDMDGEVRDLESRRGRQ